MSIIFPKLTRFKYSPHPSWDPLSSCWKLALQSCSTLGVCLRTSLLSSVASWVLCLPCIGLLSFLTSVHPSEIPFFFKKVCLGSKCFVSIPCLRRSFCSCTELIEWVWILGGKKSLEDIDLTTSSCQCFYWSVPMTSWVSVFCVLFCLISLIGSF